MEERGRWAEDARIIEVEDESQPRSPIAPSGHATQAVGEGVASRRIAQGNGEDIWTLDRIAKVIWNKFKQRQTSSGVWHVMRRMGCTNQKQQRRAIQRDDEKIAEWLQRSGPRTRIVS